MVDIVVIGGGLLGTAIARDAALRGLSVTLFEKEDFASGASSRLCRLIPGRLSALQTLDFTHVREDLHEREILLQIAPHLTRRQSCLTPFYGHGLLTQTRLRASLALADALGFDMGLPVHHLLSPAEALAREPSLRPQGLTGAAQVWEVAIPQVERLALEMALDAREHGACLHTHTQVERLRWERGAHGKLRAVGVFWTDLLTGAAGETTASLVINAAGAWGSAVDDWPAAGTGGLPDVKAVSIVGPALRGGQEALAFPREEGSLLFVLPCPGGSWVGSLETPFAGDRDTVHADGAEVHSLVQAVREFLPDVDWDSPALAQAAALASLPPADFPLPSPPYRITDHASEGKGREGLLSVIGGSLTSCRAAAEEVVDLAGRKLGRSLILPPCRTASQPLPGAHSAAPVVPIADEPALRAAVERAVAEEECRTLRDFIERRSSLFWTEDQGRSAMPLVLDLMTELCAWDRERQERERKAFEADVALTQAFRVM